MATLWQVLLILVLVLGAAFFVAAEIALVALRESQIRALATRGRRGAAVERLTADPTRFLATVQVGITLFGLLSSAVGAVALSASLADTLAAWGLPSGVTRGLGVVLVTLAIAYVTLVIGELVPKRLALQRAESFSLLSAPVLERLARVSRPVVWLLTKSANGVVRALGGDPRAGGDQMSGEELRGIVATHESLSADERRLIDEVFAAGERQVREVMVPRTEVNFLDAGLTVPRAVKEAQSHPHSRYPVVRGSSDDVVGFVHIRDLIAAKRTGKLADIAREVKVLPTTKRVLPALTEMRREGQHLAIVMDEYGGTAGIVTLEDLIEELIGDIRDEYDREDPATRTLRGGDTDVDGLLNLDDFSEKTGIELPDGPYETVAGFLMSRLGHVPKVGEAIEVDGARLKVTALDGRRVDRIRVTRRQSSDTD